MQAVNGRHLAGKSEIKGTRGQRVLRALTIFFAVWGFGITGWLVIGFVSDFSKFDQTRGGYAAPYTGWTGTPIDWAAVDVTPTGFARRGAVLDVLVNCTTGMIDMDILGVTIPFRTFSERALIVHRPREACSRAGFHPQF
jgi:hypothetical protein